MHVGRGPWRAGDEIQSHGVAQEEHCRPDQVGRVADDAVRLLHGPARRRCDPWTRPATPPDHRAQHDAGRRTPAARGPPPTSGVVGLRQLQEPTRLRSSYNTWFTTSRTWVLRLTRGLARWERSPIPVRLGVNTSWSAARSRRRTARKPCARSSRRGSVRTWWSSVHLRPSATAGPLPPAASPPLPGGLGTCRVPAAERCAFARWGSSVLSVGPRSIACTPRRGSRPCGVRPPGVEGQLRRPTLSREPVDGDERRSDQRSELNAARTSVEKSSGSSQAGK